MAQERGRTVWFEGMTLDPHHLQQWDRYQQHALNVRLRAATPYGWGLTEIEVDRERLRNGEFALTRCAGLLPDGLGIDVPNNERLPDPRSIGPHMPPTLERLPVYLAVPAEQAGGGNVRLQHGRPQRETRFVSQTVTVADENTGADERHVEVARANAQLRFEGEPLGPYTTLQIAEITRTTGGTFSLCEDFVPACLRIGASSRLMALARRLLEVLAAQSTAFTERREGILVQRELSPADVLALELLGTVNAFIPLLQHHLGSPEAHPESLFKTLLMLAGRLSAYTRHHDVSPRALPDYDHARLTGCFGRLDAALHRMLGGTAPRANYQRLPLVRQRENLFTAALEGTVLGEAHLFLRVRSDDRDEERLVAELPGKLRIASPWTIDAVLRSYTRALAIEHTNRLPAGLPVDAQASYFKLRKRGPFWEAIAGSKELALFVPSDLEDVDFQLLAVTNP